MEQKHLTEGARREEELRLREAELAAREAQLEQEKRTLEALRQAEQKGETTSGGFRKAKEGLYDRFPLTVRQMDVIIGVLLGLIVLFLVLGVNHISFFGLFGG